jgi:Phosphoglycerol transferase and related proteins, alkaline phosphatase superfamily
MKNLENIRAKNNNSYDQRMLREGFKSVRLKRNVHLIILESFFDPSLLKKIKFSRNPMSPNLLRYIGTSPAVSASSVFGGRSAQAEFEILCGAPAFSDFSDIEFSIFGGRKSYCLPSLLSEIGYATLATNSYRPDFFNSEVAYKGVGFSEAYFPKEYSSLKYTYFSHGDVGEEKYMFDGDLLNQNLNYYSNRKKTSRDVPIFNYVVSNYGHFPYIIDYNKRPKIVDIEVPPELDKEPIERIVNQFYYRSQALGIFLDELKKMDPEAVVIIVGDHLPTLEPVEKIKYGYKAYDILGYLGGVANAHQYSFLFVMCGGRKVSYNHVAQYNIEEIILDCLTDGEYCRKNKCFLPRERYHDRYLNIMSQAVGR